MYLLRLLYLAVMVSPPAKRYLGEGKLYYLERYLDIFSVGMHKRWDGNLFYIDLFSGPGICLIPETQIEFDGSPLIALKFNFAALCKEDRALWEVLGMKFDGCHCLLGRQDNIVKERHAQMKQVKPLEQITGLGKSLPILA